MRSIEIAVMVAPRNPKDFEPTITANVLLCGEDTSLQTKGAIGAQTFVNLGKELINLVLSCIFDHAKRRRLYGEDIADNADAEEYASAVSNETVRHVMSAFEATGIKKPIDIDQDHESYPVLDHSKIEPNYPNSIQDDSRIPRGTQSRIM